MEYPKIQTLFMRDKKGLIIPDSNTRPEFEYLRKDLWECTEKIDGTNMRIEIHCDETTKCLGGTVVGQREQPFLSIC